MFRNQLEAVIIYEELNVDCGRMLVVIRTSVLTVNPLELIGLCRHNNSTSVEMGQPGRSF
jgi:hypothetical protein